MKKLSLALAATGLMTSITAIAATPTHASPFEINVPDLKSGYEFTLEGFFEKPTNPDLNYALIGNTFLDTTYLDERTINPSYDFGFHAGIGYVFPDSGNDVQLGYTHLKTNDNDSIEIQPEKNFHTTLSANSTFKYNMVDLNAGQYLDVGTRLSVRLSAGLRYAEIEHNFDKREIDILEDQSAGVSVDENAYSKFEGIGPEFGINANYHVGGCFGIVGQIYTGLLIGNMRTHTNVLVKEDINKELYEQQINISTPSTEQVTPYVDTKLGVDYSLPFTCGSQLTAELGWQFTEYFNATKRLEAKYSDQNNDIGVAAVDHRISNVGFNGPYLSLRLEV